MAYQFTQTGAQIQSILDQVGTNTGDISTINTTLSNMSVSVSNTEGASLTLASSASVWTEAQSTTVTTGVYIIVFGAKFGPASGGFRQIAMTNSGAPSVLPVQSVSVPEAAGYPTVVNMTRPLEVTGASMTLHLYVRQNSGSSVTCDPFIRYVRLR